MKIIIINMRISQRKIEDYLVGHHYRYNNINQED